MAVAHYQDALAWQARWSSCRRFWRQESPSECPGGGTPSAISVHAGAGTGSTAVNEVGLQKVATNHPADAAVRRPGLSAGHPRDWVVLQGLVQARLRGGHRKFLTYVIFGQRQPGSQDFPGAARRDSQSRSVTHSGSRSRSEADIQEIRVAFVVRLQRRKDVGLHPYRGETRLNYSGPPPPYANLDTSATIPAQVSALEGSRHGNGTAGARSDDVCRRT